MFIEKIVVFIESNFMVYSFMLWNFVWYNFFDIREGVKDSKFYYCIDCYLDYVEWLFMYCIGKCVIC